MNTFLTTKAQKFTFILSAALLLLTLVFQPVSASLPMQGTPPPVGTTTPVSATPAAPQVPTSVTPAVSATVPTVATSSAASATLPAATAESTGPTRVPNINDYNNSANITFREIGLPRLIDIHYPGSAEAYVDFPDRWIISASGTSSIELHYDLEDPNYELNILRVDNKVIPRVEVYINEMFATTFIPKHGKDNVVLINIPPAMLAQQRTLNPFNEFNIRFLYQANWDDNCEYQGVFAIHDRSKFILNYLTVDPVQTSLIDYTNVLFQNSFLQEDLLIVVPDEPSAAVSEAVVNISEDIANRSTGNIKMQVVKAGQTSPAMLTKSSIMVVGTPKDNSLQQQVYSRNSILFGLMGDNQVAHRGKALDKDEGLLQILKSPYNAKYYLLSVTGNSDKAIERAYRGLINPSPGMTDFYSIERADVPFAHSPGYIETGEILFTNLAIRERTYYGIGEHEMFVSFYVPINWKLEDNTALILNYAYSENLSPKNSSVSISLNQKMLGSLPIDHQKAGDKQFIIPLQKENLRFGEVNTLLLNAIISAPIECSDYRDAGFWLTVRDTSTIYLPHTITEDRNEMPILLNPLYHLAYQSDLLISIPEKVTDLELSGLASLGYYLGKLSPVDLAIHVAKPGMEVENQNSMNQLLVGLPSTNPRIRALNDQLPQKFTADADTLQESIGGTPYRIPSDVSIGLIEVIPNLETKSSAISIVTGTTAEGLDWAMKAFSVPENRYEMTGDLIYVYQDRMLALQSQAPKRDTLDTVISEISESQVPLDEVPSAATAVPAEILDQYKPVTPEQPGQAFAAYRNYLVAGLVALALIIGIVALSKAIRGGRRKG